MANTDNISFWQSIKARIPRWRAERRSVRVGPGDTPYIPAPIDDFGVAVDNNAALKCTALYAGIRLISENIASLPKVVRRRTAAGMVDQYDNDIYHLINIRPNSYTNVFAFWSVIVTWVKGWGNAFAIIKRNGAGTPTALYQVHPANLVGLTLVNGKKYYKFVFADPDFSWLSGTYSDDDVLHFMELTLDGISGVNPILYNASAIGKSLATEKFAGEFYKKGGNIRGVMEMENQLGEEAYRRFMARFNASKNYDTPLLEHGIKYKQLSIDPVAAQLVQSETFSIQDICRLLNIPPHMVAELSHATFSNIEHQTIQFVQYSLRPVIKRIEVELETKLFDSRAIGDYDVKFILEGLLRGDTQARSAYYHNAILDGYMTRNEVRELEGMTRKDGLDGFLYPLNTGIVGNDGIAENIENNE